MITAHCPTCFTSINVLDPGEYYALSPAERELIDRDERDHAEIHGVVAAALVELGFTTHGPWEADAEENQARGDMQSPNREVQNQGVHMFIRAFFYRSILRAAELGYWRQHPDEEAFGRLLLLRTFIPKDLADRARVDIGPQTHFIDPRTQRWEPDSVRPIEDWEGDPEVISP